MNPTLQPGFLRDNRHFPAALAGVLVSLCFIVLVLMPNLSGPVGTSIIGFGSLAVIYSSLRIKYGGRIEMNAEVIYLLGIAVQYLAAPALLRLVSNDFEDYLEKQITAERWEVKEGDCGAMLIVFGYTAAFLVGSSFFGTKRLPRNAEDHPLQRFSESSMWFIGVLLVVLWLSRIALLKTGSFYHINRTDFQFEDWRYSILSQLDTTLGMLVAVHLLS